MRISDLCIVLMSMCLTEALVALSDPIRLLALWFGFNLLFLDWAMARAIERGDG